MRPWGRRALMIPPDSRSAWIQLALWELWIGGLVAITSGFGALFIVQSPTRIMTMPDLTACYGPPPVPVPCDRIVYVGGALDAAFTALCGLMLIGVALWFVWELWLAVEPKPITDDFLRLLNESFGRSWRNPLKWPWTRVLYAYGFAAIGALATIVVATSIWTAVATSVTPPTRLIHVSTSEGFRISPDNSQSPPAVAHPTPKR
ncbi:MAG TPA: hypothetical protein VM846_07965 [Vicinamibacterales bacterium]|nr:hypothetical protein [Vicinamibacterales bacterium]